MEGLGKPRCADGKFFLAGEEVGLYHLCRQDVLALILLPVDEGMTLV